MKTSTVVRRLVDSWWLGTKVLRVLENILPVGRDKSVCYRLVVLFFI